MIGQTSLLGVVSRIEGKRVTAKELARKSGIGVSRIQYYEKNHLLPTGNELQRICGAFNISEDLLRLHFGVMSSEWLETIQEHANDIYAWGKRKQVKETDAENARPREVFRTQLGKLYQGDCLQLMRKMANNSIDLIFADPPFNLGKLYPSKMDDDLKMTKYLEWTEAWVLECVRLLKEGGSLFLWNLPKWNSYIAGVLNRHLTFRHSIAVDIKYSLPIQGRLYPSHYSLLYYVNGDKPKTFHPDRIPMEVCPNCATDLRDYGGYKDKMNPKGVNLSDVWYDIPPVRHAKYKRRNGSNELSIKLLDRIIELGSNEGDVVFDPFGGSGTTYIVAEIKKRKWVGIELGPTDGIVERFSRIDEEREFVKKFRLKYNCLFTRETLKVRKQRGLWTADSVRKSRTSKEEYELEL